MATSIGHLAAIVSANTLGFTAGLNAAQKGVTSFVGTLGGLAKTGAALLGIGSVAAVIKKGFEGFTGNQEDVNTFTALLGSGEKAKTLIDELESAGRKTTFAGAFMDSAKELAKFNVGADDIVPTLQQLSQIAAGAKVPLAELAQTFGEVKTKNEITLKQLVSMQSQGIPIIQELMKTLGLSEEAVKNMVSQGRVGFAAFQSAIASATAEGGRFHNSVGKQNAEAMGGLTRVGQNALEVIGEFGETVGNAIAKVFGFQGGLVELGDWLGQLADDMGSLQPSIENVLGWFGRLWDYAAEAFEGIVDAVASCVTGVGEWLSELTGVTFADVVAGLDWLGKAWSFFWNNFPEIVKLGAMKSYLLLHQFVNDAIHLFTVTLPEVAAWFSRNWVEVFTDLFRYIGTIFENLGKNIVNVFKKLPDLIAGNTSWDKVWKPLTDGFVPTIKEALNLTGREATEFEKGMKGRIGALQGDLAKGWADAMKRGAVQGAASVADVAGLMGGSIMAALGVKPGAADKGAGGGMLKDPKTGGASDGPKFSGAFELGSKEAYNLILANRNGDGPAARTAENTGRAARAGEKQVAVLERVEKKLNDSGIAVASLDGGGGGVA
jgi:hypothetical protein